MTTIVITPGVPFPFAVRGPEGVTHHDIVNVTDATGDTVVQLEYKKGVITAKVKGSPYPETAHAKQQRLTRKTKPERPCCGG